MIHNNRVSAFLNLIDSSVNWDKGTKRPGLKGILLNLDSIKSEHTLYFYRIFRYHPDTEIGTVLRLDKLYSVDKF